MYTFYKTQICFNLRKIFKKKTFRFSQNDEIKPVFSDALFHYSSSDEGFEGSPASFRTPPSTPIRKPKLTSKWKSPAKASSCAPYLIEGIFGFLSFNCKSKNSKKISKKINSFSKFQNNLAQI